MVGRLRRVALREVWQDEARHFTPWLKDNLAVLNEALGLRLTNAQAEHSTGNFSVDLLAQDESGGAVAIENQLGRSDHDHLGKLLTYLSAVEAHAAIWIVAEPRAEHIKAIGWLNEAGLADFYMVRVDAVRIDESPAAPLLTLITGPTSDAKAAGQVRKKVAENVKRQWDQTSFFEELDRRGLAEYESVPRHIMQWARERGLREWWGRGATQGSFTVVLDAGGESYQILALWPSGTAEVQFQYMDRGILKTNPNVVTRLRDDLGGIPGVRFPAVARRPGIPYRLLANEEAVERFCAAFDQVLRAVRQAGSVDEGLRE